MGVQATCDETCPCGVKRTHRHLVGRGELVIPQTANEWNKAIYFDGNNCPCGNRAAHMHTLERDGSWHPYFVSFCSRTEDDGHISPLPAGVRELRDEVARLQAEQPIERTVPPVVKSHYTLAPRRTWRQRAAWLMLAAEVAGLAWWWVIR